MISKYKIRIKDVEWFYILLTLICSTLSNYFTFLRSHSIKIDYYCFYVCYKTLEFSKLKSYHLEVKSAYLLYQKNVSSQSQTLIYKPLEKNKQISSTRNLFLFFYWQMTKPKNEPKNKFSLRLMQFFTYELLIFTLFKVTVKKITFLHVMCYTLSFITLQLQIVLS